MAIFFTDGLPPLFYFSFLFFTHRKCASTSRSAPSSHSDATETHMSGSSSRHNRKYSSALSRRPTPWQARPTTRARKNWRRRCGVGWGGVGECKYVWTNKKKNSTVQKCHTNVIWSPFRNIFFSQFETFFSNSKHFFLIFFKYSTYFLNENESSWRDRAR